MNKNIFVKISAIAVATAVALSPALAANAAPKVQVDLPNAAVDGGSDVVVPVLLSGFTFAGLNVDIVAAEGTLTLDDASSLATLNPGFSSLVGQTEISFHAATADAVSLVKAGLHWTAPGAASVATSLQLKVQVSEFVDGQTYDPTTGHSYKFVSTPLTWQDARAAAKTMTYEGKTGYLTNITSAAENTFVANKSGASDVWFGATDDQTEVAATNTAKGLPAYVGDPQLVGHMIWADGPEAGTVISDGLDGAMVVTTGGYAGWASGEPNNWSSIEGCGLTNWQGAAGQWNDFDCTTTKSYLVEFDTTAAQFSSTAVTFDNITGESLDAVPAAAPLANTGSSLFPAFELGGVVALAGAVLLLVGRRKASKN